MHTASGTHVRTYPIEWFECMSSYAGSPVPASLLAEAIQHSVWCRYHRSIPLPLRHTWYVPPVGPPVPSLASIPPYRATASAAVAGGAGSCLLAIRIEGTNTWKREE